jgi:hypothetical protein
MIGSSDRVVDGCLRPLLLAGLFALSACVSVPEHLEVKAIPPKPPVPRGTAVVAVRWPMVITEPALEIIKERFNRVSRREARGAHRRLSDQSTYYALEMYSYLRAYLGTDAVLLEPYVVSPGEDGRLKYEQIYESMIPVAFVLDVVQPPFWFIGGFGMGDLISPSFQLAIAPSVAPDTCGLISRNPWRADDFRHFDVHPTVGEPCNAKSPRLGPHYTFLDNLAKARPEVRETFPRTEALPLKTNALLTWPTAGWQLPKEHVQSSTKARFSVNPENPDNGYAANMARVIAQGAGAMDLNALSKGGWESYAQLYDPRIATGVAAVPDMAARQRAIEVLAEAEKKWIVKQDEKIAEALLNGRFGQSFRQQRAVELAARERKQAFDIASGLGALVVGMNAGLFGGVAFNSTALAQGMLGNLSAQQDFQSNLQAFLQTELGPEEVARDQLVQVEIAGVARQVNADTRTKLREQLKQLYRERFPQ